MVEVKPVDDCIHCLVETTEKFFCPCDLFHFLCIGCREVAEDVGIPIDCAFLASGMDPANVEQYPEMTAYEFERERI